MRLQDATREFYFWMKSNGQARTAKIYLAVLAGLPAMELEEVTPKMLQDYIDHFGKLSASTLNLKKSALRSFFSWAVDVDYITKNPARLLRAEKLASREANYLAQEDITRFREVLRGASARDRLLFESYLQTGCDSASFWI